MNQQDFYKKLENFWYYYKWYVIGGLFLLCAIGIAIGSCAAKEKVDFYALCAGERMPTAIQSQQLEEWLSEKVSDANAAEEDRKRASLITVETTDQWNGTGSSAMLVQVNSGKMVLYILSESTYKILHENEVLQDLSFAGESPYLEKDRYLLSASGALDQLDSFEGNAEEYYLCLRKVEGTSFEKSASKKMQEEMAKDLIKRLIAEEK